MTLLGIDRNLMDKGPHFGSDQYLEVVSGKVGLVMGGPVRPSSYGSLWFLFEKVYDLPFTALDFNRLLMWALISIPYSLAQSITH